MLYLITKSDWYEASPGDDDWHSVHDTLDDAALAWGELEFHTSAQTAYLIKLTRTGWRVLRSKDAR